MEKNVKPTFFGACNIPVAKTGNEAVVSKVIITLLHSVLLKRCITSMTFHEGYIGNFEQLYCKIRPIRVQ